MWHHQTTPGDQWDCTATQTLTLATLTIHGEPRKVIMQAPKNGFLYVLDRLSGELLSANNFVAVSWADGVDMKTGRPKELPAADWTQGPRLVLPGPLGGHNWMPMSYSPKTGLVYIPAQNVPALLVPDNDAKWTGKGNDQVGAAALGLPEKPEELKPLIDQYKGRLIAWDPVAQKEAWHFDHSTVWNGGTLATAGNLVFQGGADGIFRAHNATTGELPWQSEANSGIVAGALRDKGMPAFSGEFTPEQVDAIHQYLILRAHDLRSAMQGE